MGYVMIISTESYASSKWNWGYEHPKGNSTFILFFMYDRIG